MNAEILIVDDDPIGGALTKTLLQEAGYSTQLINDSRKVIETVRNERPGLVILDILMPGIDGLTLCHMIKEDPAIRDTKVIMVSGKAFKQEKQRAIKYGANLFIEKPYNIETFSQQVMDVVGPPLGAPRAPEAASPQVLQVRVWGSRAKSEDPDPALKTPCVSVETSKHLFVFDAGSGILELGRELGRGSAAGKDVWILLSHYHAAHVEGLGLFPPTRDAAARLRIGGPSDPEKRLSDATREAFEASFASMPQPVAASIQLYDLQEGHYDLLPDAKLSPFYANHPGATLGFVLDAEGRRVVYCPDCELYGDGASALQDYDEKLGTLCHGADLMILDARWTDADYEARRNEGHSPVSAALDFAARHEVGELILFHQDGAYSDADLDSMEREAKASLKARGSTLSCRVARPGLQVGL